MELRVSVRYNPHGSINDYSIKLMDSWSEKKLMDLPHWVLPSDHWDELFGSGHTVMSSILIKSETFDNIKKRKKKKEVT